MSARQTMCCVHPGQRVILNIGLGEPACGRGRLHWTKRVTLVCKALGEFLQEGFHREVQLSVDVTDESTVIVEGVFKLDANQHLLLWDMLVATEQDCCAIYYPSTDTGYLFGPNAVEWGAFDKEFLKLPQVSPVNSTAFNVH